MKFIIFSLAMSFSALANVDLLVGKYQGKTAEDVASIKKVLVRQATLFDPAVYQYELNVENEELQFALEDEVLVVSKDGKSLSLNTDQECDDPGCRYFTSIDISVSKKGSAAPVMDLSVDGFDYAEDSDSDETPFYKALKYKKVK